MATANNMATGDDAKDAENLIADLEKKIFEAFDVFDHETNGTADYREVGTIIRSLGCCPTESELNDFLKEIDEEEPTGYIRYEKFKPTLIRMILERRMADFFPNSFPAAGFKPTSEDILLLAFQKLDSENKGYLTKDEITKFLTEEGEVFTQDELNELFSAAADTETGNISYKDFIPHMVVEDSLY